MRRGMLAMALVLIFMLSLVACSGGDTPADTQATTPPTDTQGTTEGESEGESDGESGSSQATDIVLSPENCVVVLADYAATWEIEAAEQLASALSLELVADVAPFPTPYTLHVGYTSYAKAQYEGALENLGDLGYIVTADKREAVVLVIANTSAGMASAVDGLTSALTMVEGGYTLSATHNDVKKVPDVGGIVASTGAWGEQITYAKSLENGVYTAFMDAERTQWQLANQNVVLNYDMDKLHGYTSITTVAGIPYVQNTGFTYLINGEGEMFSCENSANNERTNTYQLGYYYYNAHIMECSFVGRVRKHPLMGMRLDRTYHMYADKLNTVQHLVVATDAVYDMAGYGQYFDVVADRVLGICIKDKNGYHDSIQGVDWDTCEYVGFDIERAGIFGIILVQDKNSGKLTVTLQDGVYRIDQRIDTDPTATFNPQTHFYFGQRIYTDTTHSFDTFKKQAEGERHPLTTLSIFEAADGAAFVGYDALRGAYRFHVQGSDFGNAYYNTPNNYLTVNAQVQGDNLDRQIYIYTHTSSGALECAVVLDEHQNVLPLSLEVTKNFCGENEESVYDPGDTSYGQVYMPLYLPAGETKTFSILNLYQNWGQFPLKQLSSIQFTSPYYHLSCGVTETNCIAPTFVYGKDHWLLPDFRAMSAPLWASQPQHTAVGSLYVMEYTDTQNNHSNLENSIDIIDSYGPVYADVTLEYMATDGRIEATYRHVEMAHTDENRTYYSIDIEVKEDITFRDFKSDFYLFRFNSRLWHFSKLGYLDENNQHQVVDCTQNQADRVIKLGSEAPYYEYHACSDPANNDYVNFALIVKNSRIIIGGEDYSDALVVRDFYYDGRNFGDLTLDLGQVTLRAGDSIHLDIILLPWGSQESVDNRNVLSVREDAVLHPYALDVKVGSVVADTFVPKVRVDADSQTAEFTIQGGTNNAAVRVYGLSDYQKPVIEELVDGVWVAYNTSVDDFDGYMVYNDGDGTYSVAFCVDMTDVDASGRTFRVVG